MTWHDKDTYIVYIILQSKHTYCAANYITDYNDKSMHLNSNFPRNLVSRKLRASIYSKFIIVANSGKNKIFIKEKNLAYS